MSKIVLTVDDSRTMREMLMLALSNAGYRVVQAEDGMHGLEVLKDARPDVIITDINMPGWTGLVSSKACAATICTVRFPFSF